MELLDYVLRFLKCYFKERKSHVFGGLKTTKTVFSNYDDCFTVGMKDANCVSPDLTLESLGLDSLMAAEIRRTLQQSYDISMSTEKIRTLTFAMLDQLSTSAPSLSADDTA